LDILVILGVRNVVDDVLYFAVPFVDIVKMLPGPGPGPDPSDSFPPGKLELN